jgi:hypothetical protein
MDSRPVVPMLPCGVRESKWESELGCSKSSEPQFCIARLTLLCLFVFGLVQSLSAHGDDAISSDTDLASVSLFPDRGIAGVFNTEIVPPDQFQFDFPTGNLWYGAGSSTSIFTNLVADSMSFLSTPTVSLGGKHRFCQTVVFRCSILMAILAGKERLGQRRLHTASLLQGSLSIHFGDLGTLAMGAGGGTYSTRAFEPNAYNFSDDFYSWLNGGYEFPVISDWSIGAGMSLTLRGMSQTHRGMMLKLRTSERGDGKIFYARTQFRTPRWLFSLGGAALEVGTASLVAPVLEIHHTTSFVQ